MAKTTPSRVASRRTRQSNSPQKKAGKHRPGRVLRVFRWLALAFVLALVAGIGLFAWYAKDAPTITQEDLMSGGSSTLYANNKKLLSLGTENRVYVTADKIPQQLKDAVVSIEDRRFYREALGIDPIRIAGAALSNVKAKLTGTSNGPEGGSTLTQQLVKLAVFSTKTSDQTLRRKAQEAWLAVKVERQYSKAQILEFYINKVYMNYGQRGMATGAQYYYGKSLSQLNLAQTAFIAGLGQSPAGYDPYTYPDRAKARRDAVIDAMLREDKISQAQATAAKATAITAGLKPKTTTTSNVNTVDKVIDSYLTEVIKQVKAKLDVDPYAENLKIYTNMDYETQKKLYDLVNNDESIGFDDDKLQTAVTLSDPKTGAVIAQIGGRKTGDVRLAYNRATRNDRSNGSTMKPLMDYAPAIEYLNYSTYQQFDDTPYNYPGTTTPLYDFDRGYLGRISMRTALEQSRNIVAIKALDDVGLSRSVNFLKGLGIDLPTDQQVYASGIGASVTTEQETAAYGALANGGTYYKPSYISKVVTADGETVNFKNAGTRAMKSSTAYMVTDMLKGVITRGTGTSAAISGLIQAGKTGTTNYSDEELAKNSALSGRVKDSWFTGYTRDRVASVWIGYDKAQQNGVSPTEEAIPKRLYKALMTFTSEGLTSRDWVKPDSVSVAYILKGSDPGTEITGDTRNTTRELYVQGYGPTTQKAVTTPPASSSSSSSSTSSQSSSISSQSTSSSVSTSSIEPSSTPSNSTPSSSSTLPPSSSEPPATSGGSGGDGDDE
ncbi:transglycosylase domain-containing protein [Lacticaseibacillus absianus]|uniref:transglycosylase domain-containing protein n=1 Tax=Lacticaseibacillus absianus TaxID=2729623 RepID=UPI0015CC4EB1|nr:PBP1A family penicillin-binding protein [Lacticaseibacillus absianus]